jgi:hypothetical protein
VRCHRFPGIPASPAGLPEEAAEGVAGGSLFRQEAFLTIGIDGLSLFPASVLPLRAEICKSIAKTCTLKQPECCPPKKRSQKLKQCRGTGPLHFIKQESEEPL